MIISFGFDLYVKIYSNPHIIYFNISSDRNITSRIYYDSGDGYKKQNYKVIKIEECIDTKEYRIVVPFTEIKRIKFANFNTSSKLRIKNVIRIYNNNNRNTIIEFISKKNSFLKNHLNQDLNFVSDHKETKIYTNIKLNGFEINFQNPLNTWEIKDFVTNEFPISILRYFIIFFLIFSSIYTTKE